MSIVGIDFGTSSNKIACLNNYGLKVLVNNFSHVSTPSAVFLNSENECDWAYGERAIKFGINKKKQLIYDTKLMFGRSINDQLIKTKSKSWPFKIKEYEYGVGIKIRINGKVKNICPYAITGLILKNLIQISNLDLEPSKSLIIISIPAIHDKIQMQHLKFSAKVAGFEQFKIQPEPILASIAYLHRINIDFTRPQNILIYDLGAGYLDVSIISIHDNIYELFVERGEINSRQFDDNTYSYILNKMKNKYKENIDFLSRPKTLSILRQKCEEAKIILSKVQNVDIVLEDDDDDDDIQFVVDLTLTEFNEINKELFEKSMAPIEKVMEKAKMNCESIDHLFLVGGATFMRKIRELLKKTTKKVPCPSVDPREAIAIGACIAGAWINANNSKKIEGISNAIKFNPAIEILMKNNKKNATKQSKSQYSSKDNKPDYLNDQYSNKRNETKQLRNQHLNKDNESDYLNDQYSNKRNETKQLGNQHLNKDNESDSLNDQYSSKRNETKQSKSQYSNKDNKPDYLNDQYSSKRNETKQLGNQHLNKDNESDQMSNEKNNSKSNIRCSPMKPNAKSKSENKSNIQDNTKNILLKKNNLKSKDGFESFETRPKTVLQKLNHGNKATKSSRSNSATKTESQSNTASKYKQRNESVQVKPHQKPISNEEISTSSHNKCEYLIQQENKNRSRKLLTNTKSEKNSELKKHIIIKDYPSETKKKFSLYPCIIDDEQSQEDYSSEQNHLNNKTKRNTSGFKWADVLNQLHTNC